MSGRNVKCPKCGRAFLAQATLDGETSDTKKSGPAADREPFPSLPAEFGRYRVLKLLGRGGMGAVYLAHDSHLGRDVALKIPFLNASSPQRLERFTREARSAAVLHHPNICTVFDAGDIGGRAFITMAYIEGTPFEREIGTDTPMPQARVAEIVRKVAVALDYAHRKGTVHRDLKPANIMIGADGEPVVMDFGLAVRVANVDPNASRLTQDGGILGTPTYMSPEQVKGETAAIGPASDVYSLGVVLFEALTGEPPYTGAMGSVMAQIVGSPVSQVREFRTDVDPRLDAICQRAMAKNPADRFPSMSEFATALGAFLGAGTPAVREEPAFDVELVESRGAVAPTTAPTPFGQLTGPTVSRAPRARRQASSDATVVAPAAPGRRVKPLWIAVVALALLVPLIVWLAVIVLRVETPNGTLIVEIDDPAVEARIKNGKLILSGPDGKDRYTLAPGERDKKIDAGPYKVRVEGADGLTLDTPEFTLKKGDKVTVKVTVSAPAVVAKKDPPKKAAPNLDADRKAAEAVLALGGAVWVNDEGLEIKAVGDLPRDGFRLTSVRFYRNNDVSNASLACLEDCKNLKSLDLDMAAYIGDAGLVYFKSHKNLTRINLNGTRVTDVGLANFKECKSLTVIGLIGCSMVTDAGLAHFSGCKDLTLIYLADMPRLTDAGLAHFKECQYLEGVHLGSSVNITDEGVSHFVNCKGLKFLWLSGTQVSDKCLAQLKGYKNLGDLGLGGTNVTAAGVAGLRKALPGCKIVSDADTAGVGFVPLFNGKDLTGWASQQGGAGNWTVNDGTITCTGLQDHLYTKRSDFGDFHLRVETKINDKGNSGVYFRATKPVTIVGDYEAQICLRADQQRTGSLYNLVRLSENQVSADTWFTYEIIAKGPRIRLLVNGKETADYTETRPGRRADGYLALQHHDPLTVVHFRKIEIKELSPEPKDGGGPDAERKAAEFVLSIGGTVRVNDQVEDTKVATDLPRQPFRLTGVFLFDNKRVSDADLALFKGCKNLTHIILDGTKVTDIGLANFKECKALTCINLKHIGVTDAGLAYFKDMPELKEVWLYKCPVGDAGIAALKQCKKLELLDLAYTLVTDECLAHVNGFPELKTLYLHNNFKRITDAKLEQLTGLTKLTTLSFGDTAVTEKGLTQLRAAMPKCTIGR